MAPFGLALFGDSGDTSLPDRIEPCAKGHDAAFEKFIDGALVNIYNEASVRSANGKALRASCKPLLDKLREDNTGSERITAPLQAPIAAWVLEPLRLAAGCSSAKLVDSALGCLHKLVAYSYLQGESSRAGRLDDETIVSHVVGMIAKCGESSNADVQLSVIKALLTITTAEHFRAHGDCLVQAVRTMFNVAIGADDVNVQRAARNAAFQMLNAVLKHVTQYPLSSWPACASADEPLAYGGLRTPEGLYPVVLSHNGGHSSGGSTPVSSRAASESGSGNGSTGFGTRRPSNLGVVPEGDSLLITSSAPRGEAESEEEPALGLPPQLPNASDRQPHSPADATQTSNAAAQHDATFAPTSSAAEAATGAPGRLHGSQPPAGEKDPPAGTDDVSGRGTDDVRSGKAASWRDGLSPLLLGSDEGNRQLAASSVGARSDSDSGDGGEALRTAMASTRTAQLASLAESADIKGLERALDDLDQQAAVKDAAVASRERSHAATPRDARRALQYSRRAGGWHVLNTVERDLLLVITALSKMASRETGFGAVEAYMHQGKLLALDLVVRLLENRTQDWGNLRTECAEQLRQPLCLALLRNCTSQYDEAYSLATRLFTALLLRQRLREGLKAELGAFCPLLLLRPMEADRSEASQLKSALAALVTIAGDPQLLVDFFVNYDCDLQAANLFERTVKGIGKCAAKTLVPAVRLAARDAILSLLVSLDAWSGPLKDINREPNKDITVANGGYSEEHMTALNSDPERFGSASFTAAEEVLRFTAAKEKKGAVSAGIAAFNRSASKGVRLLVTMGVLSDSADDIAAFLRQHEADLDKTQMGEFLGGHSDADVAVMHAYVDAEDFSGLLLDGALRKLLASFRLPGEAQKIDRIMEKFAEGYCRDNPGAFGSADGAYLLAFALIMLNTDVHNPMADAQLGKPDFVGMCQTQGEGGRFEAILPAEDLEAMYDRICSQELVVTESTAGDGTAAGGGGAFRVGGSETVPKGHQSRALNAGLASALGMSQVLRQRLLWDKQHGVDVERSRLMEATRQAVARGLASGNTWHTASHAEHARPMLQIGATSIVKGLGAALATADGLESARRTLEGYALCVRLAGLLALDSLAEDCAAALAAAAGVTQPEAAGTTAEAVQIAALECLVAIASGPDAVTLGCGWPFVLRTLSSLDALQAELLDKASAAARAAASGSSAASLFSAVFGSGNDRSAVTPASQSPTHTEAEGVAGDDQGSAVLAQIETLPMTAGAAHVKWAATGRGRIAVADMWARSADLSGDAVVVFFRALAAISQEELAPLPPVDLPRTYCLEWLAWCAAANRGRMRLVWGRIWAVVAQHLVSAACVRNDDVALQATVHLADLGRVLLRQRDLPHFSHQDETLRPFVTVMRLADSPACRSTCVAAIADAVEAHHSTLGSGWQRVVEALGVALGDTALPVAADAMTTTHSMIDALFREGGVPFELFPEVVAACEAGVRSPWSDGHSISSLRLLQAVAVRLAASYPQDWDGAECSQAGMSQSDDVRHTEGGMGVTHVMPLGQSSRRTPRAGQQYASHPWGCLAGAFAEVARHDPRQVVADAAADALERIIEDHCATWDAEAWQAVLVRGVAYMLDLPCPVSSSSLPEVGPIQPHQQQQEKEEEEVMQQDEQQNDQQQDGLHHQEERQQREVANDKAGRRLRQQPTGWSTQGLSRLLRHSDEHLQPVAALVAAHYGVAQIAALNQILAVVGDYLGHHRDDVAAHGIKTLVEVIDAIAPALDQEGWSAVVALLVTTAEDDPLALPPAAPGGVQELDTAAALSDSSQRQHPDGATAAAEADDLRARSQGIVMLQRAVARIHSLHSHRMPPALALALVGVLQGTVERAAAFNRSPERRRAMALVLRPPGEDSHRVFGAISPAIRAACGDSEEDNGVGRGPLAARCESEGGSLLVAALLHCLQPLSPPGGSPYDSSAQPQWQGAQPSSVIEEAEQRLLTVCRGVVITAANDAWAPQETAPSSVNTPAAASAAADDTTATAPQGKAVISEDVTWEVAVRGPLLVTVLGAYSAVSPQARRQELSTLYPHLAKLVCCAQPGVRLALGALLRSQMPPPATVS